ncbi:MAG: flagellar hook-basal body complex protein FliE [Limisphaerales bacterium]|nr:MAG: flagellar hook-basal body complex protein FliE [Limisphaerales bacterium]KAG0507085.1 MAG: flagellar hook-basal body complex protein FliE [Limisphaerales bacterium]TXT49289.1 MAG: flagellar hook-basal body complex protein FliE [Limisphaerales bacterium]
MDPLSSIRSLVPGLQGMPLPKVAEDAVKQASIAPADLEQLKRINPQPALQPLGSGRDVFGEMLGNLVQGVNEKQAISKDTVNALLAGQNVPLHQAMIAMEEASVSFQLMVEVRNKLLESYQELMRMQV